MQAAATAGYVLLQLIPHTAFRILADMIGNPGHSLVALSGKEQRGFIRVVDHD
jgi:hypothetical protein